MFLFKEKVQECQGQRMQTQQGKFSRTTAGRETKFYELEEKKDKCHNNVAARPQSNAFETLSDLWLHAVKRAMLGEENKSIFRHLRVDLIFTGKLLKDACYQRGNKSRKG